MSKFYHRKVDEAKNFVDEMFKKGGRIEDDDMIMQFETPIKAYVIPKKMNVEELHGKLTKKLNSLHVLKYVACYVSEGKVYLEKLMT